MTLAVGETNQTRINAKVRRTEQRTGALETDLAALSGKFVESGGVLTYTGTPTGLFPVEQVFRLHAGRAGANVNTVQSIFGVGCTLKASTVYAFEIMAGFTKSAGTTSHQLALLFGGTATFNSIAYVVVNSNGAVGPESAIAPLINHITTAAATNLTVAMTTASNHVRAIVRGIVSVSNAGTFIPQYQLTAAPGGAYTTDANSFIRIGPIGAAGANTSIGTWA